MRWDLLCGIFGNMVGAGFVFRFFSSFLLFDSVKKGLQKFREGANGRKDAADDVDDSFDIGQDGGKKLRLREMHWIRKQARGHTSGCKGHGKGLVGAGYGFSCDRLPSNICILYHKAKKMSSKIRQNNQKFCKKEGGV